MKVTTLDRKILYFNRRSKITLKIQHLFIIIEKTLNQLEIKKNILKR